MKKIFLLCLPAFLLLPLTINVESPRTPLSFEHQRAYAQGSGHTNYVGTSSSATVTFCQSAYTAGSLEWCMQEYCYKKTDACTGSNYNSTTGITQGVCIILDTSWDGRCAAFMYSGEYCTNIVPAC